MAAHHWWEDPLAKEMHHYLLLKEQNMPAYLGCTKFLFYRRVMVDWLATLCEHFELCLTAKHLTVALYDFFMEKNKKVTKEALHIVGLGCLLVAAKFEEQESNVPKYHQLMSFLGWKFHGPTYMKAELLVLKTMDWNIGIPTAAHFLDYFLTEAMSGSIANFRKSIPDNAPHEPMFYVARYAKYFLELSLQDPMCRLYPPSLVCAAAVASTRNVLKIEPAWTIKLYYITRYSYSQLELLVKKMLACHEVDRAIEQEKSQNMEGIESHNSLHSNSSFCSESPGSSPDSWNSRYPSDLSLNST